MSRHSELLEVSTLSYVKILGDPCHQFVFDFIKITAKKSFFLSVTGGFDRLDTPAHGSGPGIPICQLARRGPTYDFKPSATEWVLPIGNRCVSMDFQ